MLVNYWESQLKERTAANTILVHVKTGTLVVKCS